MFPDLTNRFFSPDHPEQMDLPGIPEEDLEEDLKNLETINRYFGGRQATRFILGKINKTGGKIVSALDCACGAGDLTRLLAESLPASKITAVDLHPQTLAFAAARDPHSRVSWQQADIKELPYADKTFDLVTCQLALHHFSGTDAACILKELKRVSRGYVFITDLRRSNPGYAGIWLLVNTWLRHPMTRHDALLSVRRAFHEDELKALAAAAGWTDFKTQSLPWFRQSLWIGPEP